MMKKALVLLVLATIGVACWGQTKEHILPEAEELFAQADSLRRARQELKAASLGEEAVNLYKVAFGETSTEYGIALGRLAEIYSLINRIWGCFGVTNVA